VRVYAGVPAWGITASLFLTRWITNFCAPAFVFLAGASIFLHAERMKDQRALTGWLMSRGAWLVVLEFTFLRFAWTFNFDYTHYMLAGVIWMLGWCMILMGVLVRLPVAVNALVGVILIAGHNLVASIIGDPKVLLGGSLGWFWRILYFGGGFTAGGGDAPNFFVLYSIIPWIGVMAAGYAFGAVLRLDRERRRRILWSMGAGAIAAFLILRYFNLYGDSRWEPEPGVPNWIAFLSTTKYPASFLFLLMTLGPLVFTLPWLEEAKGRVAGWLTVFGRVPLFYYLLHIPLIHLLAVAISLVRSPAATGWLLGNHPMRPGRAPEGYMWSLPLLYSVTGVAVVLLYFACKRFGWFKARNKHVWLSYL
jgi:uncharacterized membrane protein